MSNFFKFVFASCLGVFLAGFVFFGLFGVMIGGLASSGFGGKGKAEISKNSILNLSLDAPLPEKSNNLPMDPFEFNPNKIVGLQDLKRSLKMAEDDDKIKGVLIDVEALSVGQATASDIRDAILDFKKSDKFVYAYADGMSQGAYYIASAADSVFMNPVGSISFTGFSAQIPFIKDMLERLGIDMQIFYAGDFKSATEPLRLYKMSDKNKLQIREYIEGLYNNFLEEIAASRNISKAELRTIANEYKVKSVEDAVRYGLIDGLMYRDQVENLLKDAVDIDEDKKLKYVKLGKYSKNLKKNFSSKNKVAVVYAEGNIVTGEGESGSIGGDKYADIFKKIRKDKKVKAVVLRVNSGGGSALASEIMWRELTLLKEKGIPIIVSMGDYAASGGYYIACMADTILAKPNTITGSIGVFSVIPNMRETFDDKIGITFDTVKTTQHSVGLGVYYKVSEEEGKVLEAMTKKIYETFLQRVADGRDMSRDEVHEIAQGRVWTGTKAKELGLVDELGDLDDAIEIAVNKAGVSDDYRIAEYPIIKEPIQQLLDDLAKKDAANLKNAMIKNELGEVSELYFYAKELKNLKGVQARIPFKIEVK